MIRSAGAGRRRAPACLGRGLAASPASRVRAGGEPFGELGAADRRAARGGAGTGGAVSVRHVPSGPATCAPRRPRRRRPAARRRCPAGAPGGCAARSSVSTSERAGRQRGGRSTPAACAQDAGRSARARRAVRTAAIGVATRRPRRWRAAPVRRTPPRSSARWTSPMVWNRSAGSLRSVRSIAAASAGFTPGTLPSSGGGGRFICMSKSSPIPSETNGSSPDTIWYRINAEANRCRCARRPGAVPRHCSGDM